MRTYTLKKQPGLPLYEALYRAIREDILTGTLLPGEKLPSKRALASNLEVGKTTVEAAYAQLLEEGYISSRERSGFFVEAVEPQKKARPVQPVTESVPLPRQGADLTGNGTGQFPFSVWIRLQREVILDYGERLLLPVDSRGAPETRTAIAKNLGDFRGMTVDPENILIGAGTDFLYNLLLQLLGQDKVYGVEDPGYGKIRKIYAAGGVRCLPIPMDESGIRPDSLGGARVLHISPSHHFPTGIVMPLHRRRALIDWARRTDGFIIEDDYDTEFRFRGHPLPPMQTMDPERVIYMNTFSKTLFPSIRISYMVLPAGLMARFREKLGFYGCTVPSFEQYTLARFLDRGYFEKHINRMRKFYRARRNRVIAMLAGCPAAGKFTILEQDAGLHFLLKVETALDDNALTALFAQSGLRVQPLGSFYTSPREDCRGMLVINYSAVDEKALEEGLGKLEI
ncbi:PLP-dependent aminotransferase family protein [Pseudoflavonifractor sp. MSJ-30]|uniref:MocR-like pyridoxine biosynthesis transcription factor PdxR n=1 Tax=Pseudoflavonifractor sp. MSJ-30 TaxID=2841525 RepID=UPI001C11539F|nr:PLP-dependent aminotransferase family protein [Pseudoflavonifractor sp. MSJ-30]MBU5451849.1 PLP-dependent aminotransferase family protein [Pseudoflavonifractor sp. MSJ-30]